MHYVYTKRGDRFERGKTYRNPRWFDCPEPDAETVEVDGDYPNIVEAYRAIGVTIVGEVPPVEHPATEPEVVAVTAEVVEQDKDTLIALLAERGIKRDSRSSVATLKKLLEDAEDG